VRRARPILIIHPSFDISVTPITIARHAKIGLGPSPVSSASRFAVPAGYQSLRSARVELYRSFNVHSVDSCVYARLPSLTRFLPRGAETSRRDDEIRLPFIQDKVVAGWMALAVVIIRDSACTAARYILVRSRDKSCPSSPTPACPLCAFGLAFSRTTDRLPAEPNPERGPARRQELSLRVLRDQIEKR